MKMKWEDHLNKIDEDRQEEDSNNLSKKDILKYE